MTSYKYIDLFSGAGGLGEGFRQAGFRSRYHVDMDLWSLKTIALREIYLSQSIKIKPGFLQTLIQNNNSPYDPELLFEEDYDKVQKKLFCGKVDDDYDLLLDLIKKRIKNSKHNIVIGGPPCQAYSLAKRSRMRAPIDDLEGSKLKEAEDLNEERVKQYLGDNRHTLFESYLNIIKEISPSAFVYENVPGILTAEKSMNKDDQKAKIIDLFKTDIGSKAEKYKLLCVNEPRQISLLETQEINFDDFIVNASDYGVPQNRRRFIIIGIRNDLTKNIKYKELFEYSVSAHRVKVKKTVKDAIRDLPVLSSNSGNNYFYECKNIKNVEDEDIPGVFNHFARSHMKEDLERYKYFSDFVLKNGRNATLYDLYKNRKDLLPDHKSGSSSKLFDASGKENWKICRQIQSSGMG